MPETYSEIAKRTVGRWAGDQIAVVGDYAEDGDLPPEFKASSILAETEEGGTYTDVSEDVLTVLVHELDLVIDDGKGWRTIRRRDAA